MGELPVLVLTVDSAHLSRVLREMCRVSSRTWENRVLIPSGHFKDK